MNCKEKLLEVRDIHKVYTKEGVPTKALNGITFDVLDGEFWGSWAQADQEKRPC